jgi:hypothetical protein
MPDDAPEEFLVAVELLRAVRLRPEVLVEEVPAPQRIAPHALALSADVVVDDEELATGRFVLLYDPAGQESWEGTFRAVTFVRAALESDLGGDPLVGEIGWTWLQESLEAGEVEYVAAGCTVTRVVSESFGTLAERPASVELEIRRPGTSPPTCPPGRTCCARSAACRPSPKASPPSPAAADPTRVRVCAHCGVCAPPTGRAGLDGGPQVALGGCRSGEGAAIRPGGAPSWRSE